MKLVVATNAEETALFGFGSVKDTDLSESAREALSEAAACVGILESDVFEEIKAVARYLKAPITKKNANDVLLGCMTTNNNRWDLYYDAMESRWLSHDSLDNRVYIQVTRYNAGFECRVTINLGTRRAYALSVGRSNKVSAVKSSLKAARKFFSKLTRL